MKTISKLHYVTPQPYGEQFYADLEAALKGGVNWVQLRMKDLMYNEMKFVGTRVKDLCTKYNATYLIDDYVDLALVLDADGVHLGLEDMPIVRARKLLGGDKIIGGTANTYHDVKMHFRDGADYVGVGPFQFTVTKKNLSPVIGLDGFHKIMTYCNADQVTIPIIAIGGITAGDVSPLQEQGIYGIALSSAISKADDIQKAAHTFCELTGVLVE